MDRRRFLKLSNAALAAIPVLGAWPRRASSGDLVNLIPGAPSSAPNYWCTWGAQTALAMLKRPDAAAMNALDLTAVIEDYINEETVFGMNGWARKFFPRVRRDLFFMFDGGWSTTYASFIADRKKFPSFDGSPQEAIRRMNQAVRKLGWRGAALWCRDTPGGAADIGIVNALKYGRIRYVKIDVGDADFHLVHLRDQRGMNLTLEHVSGVDGGLNGKPDQDGRYPALNPKGVQATVLKHTDVYRIYDLQGPLDLPTAIDRITQSIRVVEGDSAARALINAEHEVYLAAVLGCTVGIMQHPPFVTGKTSNLDQVTRALRWQRIASPLAAGAGFLRMDGDSLTDEWTYSAADASYAAAAGTTIRQGAPARVTRNLELPEVSAAGEKPFVLATRFANHAIAVGALGRVGIGRPYSVPRAAVTLDVAGAAGPFGIFGSFESLTFAGRSFSPTARVWAQDLAADRAVDVTAKVRIANSRLEIPGPLIDSVGLSNSTAGDRSLPGLVMKIV